MSRRSRDKKPEVVESGLREMKLEGSDSQEDEAPDAIRGAGIKRESTTPNGTASPRKSGSKSPEKTELKTQDSASSSPSENIDKVETVTGDVTVKMEPGQAPKLARSSSQKIIPQPAQLFDHLPEKTTEATATFSLMADCTYSAKYLGATEHSMECDCTEEWNSSSGTNAACGEDSDCINRATKMECAPDCGCGTGCQNQRFQRKEYANVSVIQTEKKGYGLRAESQLTPHQFIFEYLGEVINEVQFRRRMRDYDEEGIKHFYFMSLSKGEFIDATKKGNLGRFCNHSCNPNCYVDKWVVGDKLRMGIFAKRVIRPGEELVFNYNVDRYGADPQPCYCGEPNCTGYIGGKTQTERATKLSIDTIEALGIEDHDSWDTAVARRPRRKKAAGEDDEEYVNNLEPRALNEEGVTKVMATLLQCKEKWIAVKLLGRIQRCNEERVINRVVKMHGYQILNSSLSSWKDDFNVVLQILEILNKFPRLTRNKISDSKIDVTVDSLLTCGDDRVETGAAAILKEWSTLEVGYRIPRKKRDPNGNATPSRPERFDRRESVREERRERSKSRSKSRSRSRSPEAPRGPAAGNNPRGSGQQRKNFYNGPRAPRRTFNPLPPGWFSAVSNGNTYYYSASGQTTWSRPTTAAAQPPPPPKVISSDKKLQEIIDSITKSATPKEKTPASATPQQQQPQSQAKGPEKTPTKPKEKWRSYNEEKRKKVYENTLFPHIKYVMDKFKSKLPREDLKRFGKEIAKKLVDSDFKNARVEDPTQISSKQERQVKKFVKDFFDKAVAKRREHEKKKAARSSKPEGAKSPTGPQNEANGQDEHDHDDVHISGGSDDEGDSLQKSSPLEKETPDADRLKRKRESAEGADGFDEITGASKRLKSNSPTSPPSPPPIASGPYTSSADVGMRDADDEENDNFSSTPDPLSQGLPPIPPPPPPPPPPPVLSEEVAPDGNHVHINGYSGKEEFHQLDSPDLNGESRLEMVPKDHPDIRQQPQQDSAGFQGDV